MSGEPEMVPEGHRGAPEGYASATGGLAFIDRSDRLRLALVGKAPEQILAGLVSGRVPGLLSGEAPHAWRGRAEGSALLTPKGRMIAELRVLRGGPTAEDGFLLDVPRGGAEATMAHLKRSVPPRLAVAEDRSGSTGMLTAVGPLACEWLGREVANGLQPATLDLMADGDLLRVESERFGGLTIVRTGEVAAPAFDVFAEASALAGLVDALRVGGGTALSGDAWEVLRVEAGRPAWGPELSEEIIPVEAGIHTRVVDYGKGCFTGQEVLIRIRDRGKVNRLLRGLLLGAGPLPKPGTALFHGEEPREVGKLTSVAHSPRFGEGIALGYVRREVAPPAEVRLGSPEGARIRVRDLATDWRPPSPTGGA